MLIGSTHTKKPYCATGATTCHVGCYTEVLTTRGHQDLTHFLQTVGVRSVALPKCRWNHILLTSHIMFNWIQVSCFFLSKALIQQPMHAGEQLPFGIESVSWLVTVAWLYDLSSWSLSLGDLGELGSKLISQSARSGEGQRCWFPQVIARATLLPGSNKVQGAPLGGPVACQYLLRRRDWMCV